MTTIRPPVSSALRFAGEVRRADELEDDVERAVLLEALGVDDRRGRRAAATPSRSSSLRTVAVTCAPAARAELDRRGADAAGGAVDEQALAGAQAALGEERVVGGGEDLGHAAGLRPVEAVGDRHELALVDDGQLGLPAAADDRHDAVALGEALGARARAPTTSPASSSPGMSGGEPGGAG